MGKKLAKNEVVWTDCYFKWIFNSVDFTHIKESLRAQSLSDFCVTY